MVFRIIILLAGLLLNPFLAFSQQETYPFLAEIISENANIRAGQSSNFEKLCQLEKGDTVVILGKSYSWYKIKLPANAKSYISKKYVLTTDGKTGTLSTDKVNVRATASVDSSIIGQLNKSENVSILATQDDWYKIVPTAQAVGWVSQDLVKFKSKDIAIYFPKVSAEPVKNEQLETSLGSQPELPAAPPTKLATVPAKNEKFIGRLDLVKGQIKQPFQYQLTSNDRVSYFLSGLDHLLNDFVGYQLAVEGSMENSGLDEFSLPVVKIKNVQLVY